MSHKEDDIVGFIIGALMAFMGVCFLALAVLSLDQPYWPVPGVVGLTLSVLGVGSIYYWFKGDFL